MLNIFKAPVLFTVCVICLASMALAEVKPVAGIKATSSSVHENYVAANAVDGVVSDASRWIGPLDADGNAWLELRLPKRLKLGGVHLYSGYMEGSAIQNFHLEFEDASGKWVAIPSAAVIENTETALRLLFDATVDVETEALRLMVKKTPENMARIREVVLWPSAGDVPELGAGVRNAVPSAGGVGVEPDPQIPLIYLNQSGFNLGKPKRFTAPTLSDGTPFAIHPASGGDVLFSGKITGHIGDFTSFNPDESGDYVVKAGDQTSVPFAIGRWYLERIIYQPSMDFMIDSRHYVGNYRQPCVGSFGWRDDHHFAWVLRTLVPQYLSNPDAYTRMPRQIRYEKPQPGLWGALEPYDEDAPDIVKLIHWGADVTLTQKTRHEFLKGELAFFLYAWPMLEKWLPKQNYNAVLAFVQATWEDPTKDRSYPYDESPEHNLLALKTLLGNTKGALPPGHSVMPNLLMHEVARRDGLAEPAKYFDAAHKQVEWIVENLDWEDPLTTKGQRMSEHITMTSLAAFLQMYPDQAPDGLTKKIEDWARIMVHRSYNLWDFRRFTDEGDWTPTGPEATMWNEPGNVVGLPAALLAATPFVEDKALRNRLHELAWSHIDNCFGRNPTGRHFSYDAPREIEGVEHGWYSYYKGGIGQLEGARFVLDGAPKHVHYPYHPERLNYGWSEGWVTHNSALNVSLAYMAKADTKLELKQEDEAVFVRLSAPLNFDPDKSEPVTLSIEGPKGSSQIVLKEEAPHSKFHVGRIGLDMLGAKPGDVLKCRYGFGYMATETKLQLR